MERAFYFAPSKVDRLPRYELALAFKRVKHRCLALYIEQYHSVPVRRLRTIPRTVQYVKHFLGGVLADQLYFVCAELSGCAASVYYVTA